MADAGPVPVPEGPLVDQDALVGRGVNGLPVVELRLPEVDDHPFRCFQLRPPGVRGQEHPPDPPAVRPVVELLAAVLADPNADTPPLFRDPHVQEPRRAWCPTGSQPTEAQVEARALLSCGLLDVERARPADQGHLRWAHAVYPAERQARRKTISRLSIRQLPRVIIRREDATLRGACGERGCSVVPGGRPTRTIRGSGDIPIAPSARYR